MSDLSLLGAMALFAFVTSVTPGPNNMMLLASGVNFGFKRTIPHILGITFGHFTLLMTVGAGLETLLSLYPNAFLAMKALGLAYLIYLSWKIVRSGAPSRNGNPSSKPLSFIGAAAFQWVNPKAVMMAIGYFSNYMPADATTTYVVLTCIMFCVVNVPSTSIWVALGTQLERWLHTPKSRRIFNWTMAVLLVLSMLPVLIG